LDQQKKDKNGKKNPFSQAIFPVHATVFHLSPWMDSMFSKGNQAESKKLYLLYCFFKKNQNANQHDSLIFLFSAQPAQKTSNKLLGPLIRG